MPYDRSQRHAVSAIATASRGSVYVTAEELADDVELKTVDELYRSVGLRRMRKVWLAYGRKSEPVGTALVYRGPLGVNFSFLENRCDLLLHPDLSAGDAPNVVMALLKAAVTAYEDFEIDAIPVIADPIASPALTQLGAEYLRQYCQGIWLKEGSLRFYRHVDGFYSKLLARAEKRIEQPVLVAQEY